MHAKHGKNASMRKLILHIKTLNFFFKFQLQLIKEQGTFLSQKCSELNGKLQIIEFNIKVCTDIFLAAE